MTPEILSRLTGSVLARQFMRFVAVGAVATTTHYAILILLREVFAVPVLVATSIGFIAGGVVSYTLNRRVTFATRPAYGRGLAKFFAFATVGFFLNGSIMAWLIAHTVPYLLAQVVATGVVLFWNFASARLFVFRA